jgi:hypothetical protein
LGCKRNAHSVELTDSTSFGRLPDAPRTIPGRFQTFRGEVACSENYRRFLSLSDDLDGADDWAGGLPGAQTSRPGLCSACFGVGSAATSRKARADRCSAVRVWNKAARAVTVGSEEQWGTVCWAAGRIWCNPWCNPIVLPIESP